VYEKPVDIWLTLLSFETNSISCFWILRDAPLCWNKFLFKLRLAHLLSVTCVQQNANYYLFLDIPWIAFLESDSAVSFVLGYNLSIMSRWNKFSFLLAVCFSKENHVYTGVYCTIYHNLLHCSHLRVFVSWKSLSPFTGGQGNILSNILSQLLTWVMPGI
jgi:hypothetical protein